MIVFVAPPMTDRRAETGRAPMVAVAHMRLMILMLVFTAAVLLIVMRLAMLALFAEPRDGRDAAAALAPLRADIVDRNGAPLARTIDAWTIGVRPGHVIGDRAELARGLAALLPERSAAEYLRILNSRSNFVYLRRRAVPQLVAEVNALGEPGIAFSREPERLYPQSGLAASVLGYLNIDGKGMLGMEKALQRQLTDPQARGEPVALSIDSRVQAAFESELSQAMMKFSAIGAGGLILDVDSGEVLAMVSLPSFNPNAVSGRENELNLVTQGVYELGSTFKPLTMATAIETGLVTSMATRYDATAPLQVGRFRIRDDHAQNRYLNVPEALVHSSNIVTARIADALGQERMAASFRALGFDTPPHIEIEKAKPQWPGFWARTTVMTSGYGHGIAVTPLHLANAYATLVNGGIWRPTTLMKIAPGKAPKGRRVYAQATSDRMRQLLRLIALEGTGRRGDAPGYRVGGKTGTAERAGAGGYSRKVNVSTFAAAFPMDAPRYVVIAMLDSPKGTADTFGFTTAAWTVAPVVSRVIQRSGPMLGVYPDMRRDIDVSDLTPLLWKAPGDASKAAVE